MNKKLLGLGIFASLLIASCSSDEPQDNPGQIQSNDYKVTTDSGELSKAINLNDAGVISVLSITKSKNRQSAGDDTPQVSNIALEQIASVDAPVLNGQAMRADHVDISGDYAYVSYNKEGETYLGGIDIIDISDKFNPIVVSRMTTAAADVNGIFFKNNSIYFTGAYDDGLAGGNHSMIGHVKTANGEFTSDFTTKNEIAGHTGVDILAYNDSFLALTGNNGILGSYKFNSGTDDFETLKETEFSDLRSAAYSNGKLAVLSGDNGLIFLNSDFGVEKSIAISGLTAESKRTISFYGDNVMVSEGPNGVGIYNPTTGNMISRLPIQLLPDAVVSSDDKVTNAVALADGFIFMANGGAGLGVSKLDANNVLLEEGLAELNGSSNYVKAVGDYIFVASGTGGMRILKMSRSEVETTTFLNCSEFGEYKGNSNLNVNSNEKAAYSGALTLKHLNVGGEFSFCGSLNVEKSVNFNSFSESNISGAFAVGEYGKNENLSINSKSVLRIEGSLVVYGDLNLNSGATLEFISENSSIHVYGRVSKGSGVTIKGNYKDTSNKL